MNIVRRTEYKYSCFIIIISDCRDYYTERMSYERNAFYRLIKIYYAKEKETAHPF